MTCSQQAATTAGCTSLYVCSSSSFRSRQSTRPFFSRGNDRRWHDGGKIADPPFLPFVSLFVSDSPCSARHIIPWPHQTRISYHIIKFTSSTRHSVPSRPLSSSMSTAPTLRVSAPTSPSKVSAPQRRPLFPKARLLNLCCLDSTNRCRSTVSRRQLYRRGTSPSFELASYSVS